MGSAPSQMGGVQDLERPAGSAPVSVSEIINLMMPVYYTTEPVTSAELHIVRSSWQLILDNKCPAFFKKKSSIANISADNCIEFFSENFYSRLFNVSPVSRALFTRDIKSQGTLLCLS